MFRLGWKNDYGRETFLLFRFNVASVAGVNYSFYFPTNIYIYIYVTGTFD